MEQLIFELVATEPPTLRNFVAGRNSEAVSALARVARGELRETGLVLWGAGGGGKSHLLRAAAHEATVAGRAAHYAEDPAEIDDRIPEPGALICVDAIDTANAEAQGRLFTLYNALAACDGQLVAAAAMPPARLALRADLRTRLGQGLIYEVLALGDADKAAALAVHARERGFRLSDEVIGYLLSHHRRDMPAMVALLAALDRHSLATKRPITVPLLRDWLRDRGLDGMG